MSAARGAREATRALAALTGAGGGARPPAVGVKFDARGAALPIADNTIICHIDPDSAEHAALCSIQSALKAAPFAPHFNYLPPSSFHMTVFEGVSADERRAECWPDGLPLDASIAASTEFVADRLKGLSIARDYTVRAEALYAGIGIRLTGADPGQEEVLRGVRDRIAAVTGLRKPNHETYVFHVTLAYLMRWLSEDDARAVHETSAAIFERHRPALASIALGPPELCTFETMHRFDRLRYL